MATTEKELTLKASPAEAPRLDTQAAEAPSRVTVATAESLGLRMEPHVEVPAWAEAVRKEYEQKLVKKVEAYLDGMEALRKSKQDGTQELGEITSGNYVGLDLLSFSPIQAISLPPYAPSRIIGSGEDAVIFVLVFINPLVDQAAGFITPATVQLGARPIRVRVEQVNLTDVTNGDDFTAVGTLSSPAPTLTLLAFPFTAADPGVNPALIEANVTVDIDVPGQPWAAFATNHFSVDDDPGFLGIPPQPPQVLSNIPLRYLVYSL